MSSALSRLLSGGNVVRYADDFVETVITHIKDGFDFLGRNVRKYRNRTLLIKPSRKSIRVFLEGVRGIIRDSQSTVAC